MRKRRGAITKAAVDECKNDGKQTAFRPPSLLKGLAEWRIHTGCGIKKRELEDGRAPNVAWQHGGDAICG